MKKADASPWLFALATFLICFATFAGIANCEYNQKYVVPETWWAAVFGHPLALSGALGLAVAIYALMRWLTR